MDLLFVSDDVTVSESIELMQFLDRVSSSAATIGLDLREAPECEDLLVEAGCKNIASSPGLRFQ